MKDRDFEKGILVVVSLFLLVVGFVILAAGAAEVARVLLFQ